MTHVLRRLVYLLICLAGTGCMPTIPVLMTAMTRDPAATRSRQRATSTPPTVKTAWSARSSTPVVLRARTTTMALPSGLC